VELRSTGQAGSSSVLKETDMPEHFDLIVIGSGAGGGTLAHAGPRHGHRTRERA
jgi:glycerol-3-phosphate dehydrogenase